MTLNEYAQQIHKTAVEHGWWEDDRNFGEVCMLITSEVAEAFEEYRNGHLPDEIYLENGKPEGVPVELADVIIRCLDFMHSAGIDIDAAMQQKMAYNEMRPYRHGGKLA